MMDYLLIYGLTFVILCISFYIPMRTVKHHLIKYNSGTKEIGVWDCIVFILQFLKFTFLYPYYYIKGRSVILHDKSVIIDEDNYIDIIVVIYKGIYSYKNVAVFCSGVDLLVNKIKNRIHYKIHLCYTRDDVKSVIEQEQNKRIWIFGHGRRYRLEFGDEFLYYEELKDYPKKIYIKQVHCNPYGGKSLVDYLCDDKRLSFVSNGDVFAFENRKYIEECDGEYLI